MKLREKYIKILTFMVMSDAEFSQFVKDKEREYNDKQAYLKLPPEITFKYAYPDINFSLLVKVPIRTDDGCSHYLLNDEFVFSRNFGTNTWSKEEITPFFFPYINKKPSKTK
jgi:hypothetical protein